MNISGLNPTDLNVGDSNTVDLNAADSNTTGQPISVGPLPGLTWVPQNGAASFDHDRGQLTVVAEPGVDWSNDSVGGSRQTDASLLGFEAPAEFSLSARVRVGGQHDGQRTTFDAGVLALWSDSDHWAKLCFEYSPAGQPMVVSVVTNEYSDDCNSSIVTSDAVYLRITRTGPAWAFHASADGITWDFVRLFRLATTTPVHVGFLSQAPMGQSCVALFNEIRFSRSAVRDLRDGS
ncbi:DUF1349 domain-containing protein [Leifsonia kafniensis]|uniref:DUF1349 domain-containing protein n=1 Tax=Leifsonia kafniensis TaxID=475957 RepID=A0ABP7K2I8_9MICO